MKRDAKIHVVFGSSLAALQFAHQSKAQIILENPTPPYIFEKKERRESWNLLYTKLMIDGQTLGGDSVVSTKLTDDYIFIVSKGNVVNKIKYHKLTLFSDKNVIGLPPIKKKNPTYKVVDLLVPISLSVPHLTHINTDDDFVSDVFFVKEGLRTRTELYALSTLSEKEVEDFDYSDTMVRFKCQDLLKQHGFEGARNGKKKLLIKLETVHRELLKQMDYYEETEKIQFIHGS